MESTILTKYIDKIYKFAISRTFSEDEADELSQEILLNAVVSLPKLREERKFEPWLWGLAENTSRSFRRKLGKQRAMFVYNAPESLIEEVELDENDEELYDTLREKIVMLSKMYREVVILYYYDGLSTKEISERLEIPIGTVTWRLSEARNKLRKEYENMQETALRPVTMRIDIYGSGNYGKEQPFPDVYINDALSQNILYYCYENPKSIEELAKLCGVPAYYVEDRIENLVKRYAVIQPVKGKYQTDFIIWTDKYGKHCEENAEKALMPMMDRLVEVLEKLYEEADKIDFYRAGKATEELKFLYGVMAFEHLSANREGRNYPQIPINYDGNNWRYIANMESGKYRRTGIGTQRCSNRSDISRYRPEGTYQHTVYAMKDFGFRMMMYDNYINVCQDVLQTGRTEDEQSAVSVIQEGYIKRGESGELVVTVPAFTKAQKETFDAMAERLLTPLMPEYFGLVEKFLIEYKKLFPKHLEEDAKRLCCGFFMGFYDTIAGYCIKKGLMQKPDSSWICDVMVQWR